MLDFIAHRGYSLEYPDNSFEAIDQAIKRGYKGIEIDVQLCKSGEIVLYHDIYAKEVEAFIKDMTLDELKTLGIISLHELYEKLPDIVKIDLFIDLKGTNKELVRQLEIFYEHYDEPRVIFCSFNRPLIRTMNPKYKIASTFEAVYTHDEYSYITLGLSAVVIHWTCLDHAFIAHCKANNINVYTYTHKAPKELEHMLSFDVDGIITNGFP